MACELFSSLCVFHASLQLQKNLLLWNCSTKFDKTLVENSLDSLHLELYSMTLFSNKDGHQSKKKVKRRDEVWKISSETAIQRKLYSSLILWLSFPQNYVQWPQLLINMTVRFKMGLKSGQWIKKNLLWNCCSNFNRTLWK